MTREELQNIAHRMDEETRDLIDGEVEERLQILRQGDLTEEELQEMEEYLYASLILEEYLNGEYELLEEERQELFDEMEEMYNKYADLLVRARIEEKVSKKKRMTLELMKIREQLMNRKADYKDIKQKMKDNRENYNKLKDLNKKENMKELSKPGKGRGGIDGLPAKGDVKASPKQETNMQMHNGVREYCNHVRDTRDGCHHHRHRGGSVEERLRGKPHKTDNSKSLSPSRKRYPPNR